MGARRQRQDAIVANEQPSAEKPMDDAVPNHAPLAPAISPLPPNDRRRARAAGCPTRRLSTRAGDVVAGTRPRPPFECIALLLQGGGALGAYQAGVYEALAEAGLHPNWVAGISIGSINAAIIAGNPPGSPVEKLPAFWEHTTPNPPWSWANPFPPSIAHR